MNDQEPIRNNQQILKEIQASFIPHQNFNYALLGGLGVCLLCALIWAAFTVITEYQIGLIAIAVGLLVGFSVRYFGAGLDLKYNILGGGLALLSCLLGNLFAIVGFLANEQMIGYVETFQFFDLGLFKEIMVESFSPMDLLFYAIAAYEGFKFSTRLPTDNDLEDYYKNRFDGKPDFDFLRGPLAIGSFLLLSMIWFFMTSEFSGEKEFRFEDGEISAKGNYVDGNQDGLWDYFHNNGEKQASGVFKHGLEEGTWEYFDSTGQLNKTQEYASGMSHGIFMTYVDGAMQDSGRYVNNREEGKWISRYPNGQLMFEGTMVKGKTNGKVVYYHENGAPSSAGLTKNDLNEGLWKTWNELGQLTEEIEYKDGELDKIIYVNEEGKDIVVNGNGDYSYKDEEGRIMSLGKVEQGNQIGIWKSFYTSGALYDEIEYSTDDHKIVNIYDRNGERQVKDGNGILKLTYESGNLQEEGEVKNGKRVGAWKEYYDSPSALSVSMNYENGKLNGRVNFYNIDKVLLLEGECKDDRRHGLWKWYFLTGAVESQVEFKKGEKEGVQTFFNESGLEVKQEVYKNGELINEIILNEQ